MSTALEEQRPVLADPAFTAGNNTLRWVVNLTFADRAVWRRIATMAVGIGLCTLALLGLAGINPTLERMAVRTAALQPIDDYGSAPVFTYHLESFTVGEQTVTGTVVSGDRDSPAPPGIARFPRPGEIYASPRLAASLSATGSAALHTMIPGVVVGIIPADRLRGADDLFFYRGSATTFEYGAAGWGRGPSSAKLEPRLVILLSTGAVLLFVPLMLFIALAARVGSARRERRNGILALLGADRRLIRLLGAVESRAAGILGVVLGLAGLLGVRAAANGIRFQGVGIHPQDLGPSSTGLWSVTVGVVAVATVSGALVSYRPTDSLHAHQSAVRQHGTFRWWWRVMILVATVGGVWVLVSTERLRNVSRLPEFGVLAPSIIALLLMSSLVAWCTPLVGLICKIALPSSLEGQLARGRILADRRATSRPAAALGSVLAAAIALLPLLAGTQESSGVVQGFGYYTGTVADVQRIEAAAQVDGLQFIGVGGSVGADASGDGNGPVLGVVNCATVVRIDPTLSCADGDTFAFDRNDSVTEPLGPAPYVIDPVGEDLASTHATHESITWSPPPGTRTLAVVQDADKGDEVAWNLARADFLLTPGAVSAQFPSFRNSQIHLFTLIRLDPGALPTERQALTALGDQGLDLLSDHWLFPQPNPYRSWIVGGLLGCGILTLLICALALSLNTVEQIREHRRPYALGRAAGLPLAVLSRAIALSLLVPILTMMVAATGTGMLLDVTLRTVLDQDVGAVQWPMVTIGIGGAVLTALLVAAGAGWSLRRATGSPALRTE